MADGEITLKLDAQTQARLEAAAQAAGRAIDDYQRTGIGYDAITEMAAFVARVASRSGRA